MLFSFLFIPYNTAKQKKCYFYVSSKVKLVFEISHTIYTFIFSLLIISSKHVNKFFIFNLK